MERSRQRSVEATGCFFTQEMKLLFTRTMIQTQQW